MKRPYIILALYIVVRNYSTSRELTKRIHRFMKSIGKSVLFRQSPLEHFQFVDRIHSTKSEHILYKRFIIVIVDCLAPHHIIEHLVTNTRRPSSLGSRSNLKISLNGYMLNDELI